MKKVLLFLFWAAMIISAAGAQDVSETKEIAVFSLSSSSWNLPAGSLDLVDGQVADVFARFGHFEISRWDFRLESGMVPDFTARIQGINETDMAGDETFADIDFSALTSSFLIVIPSLEFYDSIAADYDDGTEWEVELHALFSIINLNDVEEISQFSVNTFGSGETQEDAVQNAADAISSQLEFELRSLDAFQLESGILEVMGGGKVILGLGRLQGLSSGDEFSIVDYSIISTEQEGPAKTGLIIVTNVQEELSYARIVYSNEQVSSGDQLVEIPRFGGDFSVYAHGFIDSTGLSGGTLGLRAVLTRGFFDLRPLFGVEFPLVTGTLRGLWPGLPLSVYLGGELVWYLGRFQIQSAVSLGVTGLFPVKEDEQFFLTHVGGTASVAANWMFDDNLKVFVEGGYCYWYSVAPSALASVSEYGGIFGGLGVTFKL